MPHGEEAGPRRGSGKALCLFLSSGSVAPPTPLPGCKARDSSPAGESSPGQKKASTWAGPEFYKGAPASLWEPLGRPGRGVGVCGQLLIGDAGDWGVRGVMQSGELGMGVYVGVRVPPWLPGPPTVGASDHDEMCESDMLVGVGANPVPPGTLSLGRSVEGEFTQCRQLNDEAALGPGPSSAGRRCSAPPAPVWSGPLCCAEVPGVSAPAARTQSCLCWKGAGVLRAKGEPTGPIGPSVCK